MIWVFAIVVVVESWHAPFGYRQGDFVSRGVDSRIDFERTDFEESERKRRDAEDAVPPVFRNNPASIDQLPEQLRADLGEISSSVTIEDVSEATRDAFGFGVEQSSETAAATFASLQAAVEPAGPLSTDVRIEDIVTEFANFSAPLKTAGVVNIEDVQRLNLSRRSRIRSVPTDAAAVDVGATDSSEAVSLIKVQLADQLNDGGELGRSWAVYPHLTEPIRPALKAWLASHLQPTLTFDSEATKQARGAARDAVGDVVERYDVSEPLVPPQSLLDAQFLPLLQAEHTAVNEAMPELERLLRIVLAAGLVLILIVLNAFYIGRVEPRIEQQLSRLAVYATTVVFTVAVARALSFDPWRAEIAPVLAVSMVFCVAYSQVFATVSAFTLCLLVTLSTTGDVRQFVVLIATTAAALLMTKRIQKRDTLVRVGFATGLIYIAVFFAMQAVGDPVPWEVMTSSTVVRTAVLGGAWCLFCGFLVTGLLPFVESTFGVVTDISLLELSDPSHELLQELTRRAPGTYNHSINVGSISEKAAEAVGANGLLCRVAAYFHDVGKMLKPDYFIENLGAGEESPHKQLAPAMSKLVIIGHVKDGVDLAEQHNLPRPLIDFIEQHHGTTLVEYFYREASKQAEGRPDNRTDAEEEEYRYPGPKPQSVEAAVMMLADACESASRALTDPTPRRLEQLVRDLSMKRLLDGQFDECGLTLSDLHKVEHSIAKSLTATFHGRVKYPDAKTA